MSTEKIQGMQKGKTSSTIEKLMGIRPLLQSSLLVRVDYRIFPHFRLFTNFVSIKLNHHVAVFDLHIIAETCSLYFNHFKIENFQDLG